MELTGTTQQIQRVLERLLVDAPSRDRVVNELVTHAFVRLEILARRMLRGFPKLRDETGDLLAAAYPRIARALHDDQVLTRMKTPQDFFNLAAVQMRRELIDLSRCYGRRNEQVGFGGSSTDASAAPQIVPTDETYAPDRLAQWSEFHEQVEHLPDAEREVFTHVWYHDLPYVEAAEILGCDERTVRRRYQSARRMLFDRLGGHLPF